MSLAAKDESDKNEWVWQEWMSRAAKDESGRNEWAWQEWMSPVEMRETVGAVGTGTTLLQI
jgi:hypothetical protein